MKKGNRLCLMGVSLFLSAVLYNVLILPLRLITGGIHGIAEIIYYVSGIKSSISLFFLCLILLGISYLFLGKERTIGSAFFSFSYPLLVELTSPLNNLIEINNSWKFIIVILGGTISAILSFMMYKSRYSNGGLPILSQILYEKYHLAIAKTSFLINLIILIIGSLIFQKNSIYYSLLFLVVQSTILKFLLKKI
ncbi:MAG: YitT family protein [Bacilli bacterium]|nr:YitT family protein [Bacilli bacterium]